MEEIADSLKKEVADLLSKPFSEATAREFIDSWVAQARAKAKPARYEFTEHQIQRFNKLTDADKQKLITRLESTGNVRVDPTDATKWLVAPKFID